MDKGTSAGGRHGSKAKTEGERTDTGDKNAQHTTSPLGLNENTGEFRVGENIVFGIRNGNIRIMRSPQGEEVEVAESVLAGLMVDAFFTDKFGDDYKPEVGAR